MPILDYISGEMNDQHMIWAWVAFSAFIIVGFFAITYLLMFYPVVVGSDKEWEYIKIGYGALATMFVQVVSTWMTWFARWGQKK